jgi:hypothetical protein
MIPLRPRSIVLGWLLGALLALSASAPGQTPKPAGVDDAALEALAKEAAEARDASLAGALEALDKASASPKAAETYFYECVKAHDFKRDLDVSSKFEDWRRAFADQWRGRDLGYVLQLQLRHQALVLRTARTKDKATMTGQWLSLAESIVSRVEDAMFGASFLAQPIQTSVFDKALKLRQLAGGAQEFGAGPLDIGGMFDRHILPHVPAESRRKAWERRIELQSEFARKTLLPSELEDFERFELPRLRWRQLADVRFPGGAPADEGSWGEAAEFIRHHLKHPDAEGWVNALRESRSRSSQAK